MSCTYLYKNKKVKSYQKLIELISQDDLKEIASVVFSLETKQNLYDELSKLNETCNFKANRNSFLDDVDIENSKGFTTQTFVDSGYFLIDGKPPMFRLDFDEYASLKRADLIRQGFTEQQAIQTVQMQKDNWQTIADNANTLHKIIVSSSGSQGDKHFAGAALNTPFQPIYDKLKQATNDVEKYVLQANGGCQLIKNLNISANLRNIAKNILGHADYVCIRDDGTLDIYNLAVSTENESDWSSAKKEKYRYKLALLKRILEYNGIKAPDIRVNLVPIKIKYDESYQNVIDISVAKAIKYDMIDSKYTMSKYDKIAANFIEAKINNLDVNDSDIEDANMYLNYIFPYHSFEVTARGLKESAQGWIKANWRTIAKPAKEGKGWDIKLGEETIHITDTRIAEKNEELIQLIQSREEELFDSTPSKKATYRVVADIKQAYKQKLPMFYCSLKNSSFIQRQLNKYFEHTINDDNEIEYKWQLIDNDTLTNANILLFQNTITNQVDVVTITPFDVGTKTSYKGRNNLLGSYISDINNKGFITKANYGNIEAVRTMTVLNQVLPKLPKNIQLGTLKIVGISSYHNKKGCEMDMQQVLPIFKTVIDVVNENNSSLNMINNFSKLQTKVIDPAEALVQSWREAIAEHSDITELKELEKEMVDQHKTDGTTIAGLESTATIEGKIAKLEAIIDKINSLNKLPSDPKRIQQAIYSADPYMSTLAKVYASALHALNLYNNDISIENETFSSFEEYFQKPQSIGNTNVRTVTQMFQRSVNTIADKMLKEYSPLKTVMEEFFKAKGYTAMRNSTIGDEARIFSNLYETDLQNIKTMRFKNPYDPNVVLDDAERKFLKEVLFEINKIRYEMRGQAWTFTNANDFNIKKVIDTTNWLDVPLQKASVATRRLQAKSMMVEKMKNFYKRVMHPQQAFEEFSNNLLTQEDKDEMSSAIQNLQVYNPYTRSEDINRRANWINMKGVDFFETNVENILIDFMEKHIQSNEYKKMLVRTSGVLLDLYIKGETEDDSKNIEHTIKTIDDFLTTAVYNQSIMEPTSKIIDNYLSPMRTLISRLYIAGNVTGAVRDTLQGLFENIARSVNKYQTDITFSDVMHGYKEVILEGPQNIMTISKLNQLNLKYRLSNMDIAKISEGQKTCRGGILNWEKWAYSTLYGPDYLNRLVLFSAQMHHDGVDQAYYIKDKQLVYDWTLDKRFTAYAKNDKSDMKLYNKQRSLYLSLLRMFNVEHGTSLKEGDALPDAYTNQEITSFKNMADSIYGAYNQSTKAKYENVAIGRNFALFSTWMNGTNDNYLKKPQLSTNYHTEIETRNGQALYWNKQGEAVTLEEGGDKDCPVLKYVPDIVQGIIYTIKDTFKEFYYNGTDGVKVNILQNNIQRANLKKLLSDLLIAMIVAGLMGSVLGATYKAYKENMTPKDILPNAIAEAMFKGGHGATDSLAGPFGVINYVANNTNPAALKTTFKVYDDTWRMITGQRSIGDTVMGSQALLRSFQDTYKLWAADNA